jgi:hypothetical protein
MYITSPKGESNMSEFFAGIIGMIIGAIIEGISYAIKRSSDKQVDFAEQLAEELEKLAFFYEVKFPGDPYHADCTAQMVNVKYAVSRFVRSRKRFYHAKFNRQIIADFYELQSVKGKRRQTMNLNGLAIYAEDTADAASQKLAITKRMLRAINNSFNFL